VNEERPPEEPCPLLDRRATACDGAAVAELLCQLGYPSVPSETGARLERLARSADDYVLVAESGQQVAGVVKLHIMPNPGDSNRKALGENHNDQIPNPN